VFPLRDNLPTRRFPVVTVALIVANIVVFVLYQARRRGRELLLLGQRLRLPAM
jgi:hypothetical protein